MTPVIAALAFALAPQALDYRWVYAQYNLQVEANVEALVGLMRRAKAAGYNGIVLADYKLSILDAVPDFYPRNVARIKAEATKLELDIIPAIFGIGYSSGLLSHDPNLAEGMPVRNFSMTVEGGIAKVDPSEAPEIQNLDFEASSQNTMTGWGFQDGIGKTTFADTEIKHGGRQSLRMENIGKLEPEHGNCRVSQLVKVKPWRQYHVSAWVKTEGFDRSGDVRIMLLDPKGNPVTFAEVGVQPNQDWKEHHVVFNSQANSELRLYFGVWGGKQGRLWWDSGKFEPVAFLNVLRRGGCPLEVRDETGIILKEGVDYEPIRDPKLGTVPWPGGFEVFHESPTLRVKTDSRRLRASYYHLATTLQDQVTICPSEPKTYALLTDEFDRVTKLLEPKGYFLSHDEIRVGNWCGACQRTGHSPGKLLADNVQQCIAIAKKKRPKSELFIWSDMFDPNHNAKPNYYLNNGTLEKSWEGLDNDVVIVDWYFDARKKTLPFFAGRGHRQILAGYYDGPVENIRTWLDDAKSIKGVCGVMYTTWVGDYSNLESFAKAAWGR